MSAGPIRRNRFSKASGIPCRSHASAPSTVRILAATLWAVSFGSVFGQVMIRDPYLVLGARAGDPVFTTYAADLRQSRFFADKAYFLDAFHSEGPITKTSQFAGEWALVWKINNVVLQDVRDFRKPPTIVASFADMAVFEYELLEGLSVQEVFLVHSSGAAVSDLAIRNSGRIPFRVRLYSVLFLPDDSLSLVRGGRGREGIVLTHSEPLVRLHSNLYANRGYPEQFRDILIVQGGPDSWGVYPGFRFSDFYHAVKRMSKVQSEQVSLNEASEGPADFAAIQKNLDIPSGRTVRIRFVRGCHDLRNPESELAGEVRAAMEADIQACVDSAAARLKSVPRLNFSDPAEKMVYLGAFNLVRQCMLPPSGKTQRPFYVFSRNPVWGWGHGHQVMHESLSMLTMAFADPALARESQRVYIDQQYEDGLVGYRHGPRGPQVYPHEGQATTSAPFFSWTNWEVFCADPDTVFLQDAYRAGALYVDYLLRERDKDKDGLLEWGPYGIIENVRDGWNAVFQLFSEGEDEGRDISDEIEALDLSVMAAHEMLCLARMAKALKDSEGEKRWSDLHRELADKINRTFWDPEDRFYYHVDMKDHTFSFEGKSLKRKEIIGFLPLWAGIADREKADALVRHLEDPDSFWRTYGVPTLAADDPQYTPFVDGCCRWNGPVWLLWDYMVFRGLLEYGYSSLAQALADKMILAVTTQLSKNNRFWESYSPDFPVLESPSNYIWDSIMARVFIDRVIKKR